MVTRSFLINRLPYSGIETLYYKDGSNSNIIAITNSKLQSAVDMMAPVAKYFKGNTDLETVKNVFNFLLYQITYKADGSKQRVKLPNALVNIGVGDCKSYTLFAAAVLINLGFNVTIRYAGYNSSKPVSHVYLIANNIVCDAVLGEFNKEAVLVKKKDYIIAINN